MINKTCIYCCLLMSCFLVFTATPLLAADAGGLSVGYESLSSSKDDPKSRNVGSITAKYGFGASKELKPYVGTGLAYSYSEPNGQKETIKDLKTSVAGQVGINYQLKGNVSLNLDYKFLNLQPDARTGSSDPSTQKLGIGLDIKF
jgi:outer membrane autotransporter protein